MENLPVSAFILPVSPFICPECYGLLMQTMLASIGVVFSAEATYDERQIAAEELASAIHSLIHPEEEENDDDPLHL